MRIHYQLLLFLIGVIQVLALDWQADPDTCGLRSGGVSLMIVGGNPAKDPWPWQVAMYEKGVYICGGSIISPWWVVTAAHCIEKCYLCQPEIYTFQAGTKSLVHPPNTTQDRVASKVFVHPDYDWNADDNDIALFKMSEPFVIGNDEKVNTVCLPTEDMDDQFYVGKNATVTGWGSLDNGAYPDELYEVMVPIYNQTICNVSQDGKVTDNMICAGLPEGGVDACQGDSGGPLVAFSEENEEQYYLIGIVSFGVGCGEPNSPGVYTRVTRYEEWLRPIFNGTILDTYVPCICEEGLSTAVIASLATISVILAISIVLNARFGYVWWKHNGKQPW